MEESPKNNKAKRIIAAVLIALVLIAFLWTLILLLFPADEVRPEATPPSVIPVAPEEVTPPTLPQTGVSL